MFAKSGMANYEILEIRKLRKIFDPVVVYGTIRPVKWFTDRIVQSSFNRPKISSSAQRDMIKYDPVYGP